MNVENKLSLLRGKTVSKLFVVLFAALLCSVLVLATADDSAAVPFDANYDITFNFEIDGEPYSSESELSFGVEIVAPFDVLEKESDNYFDYTFVGWELSPEDSGIFFINGDTVTGDATYNAKYTSEERLFAVTFNFEIDNEPYSFESELSFGVEIVAPFDVLEKESVTQFDYTFVGWELSPEDSGTFLADGETVTGDATYNAKFSSEPRIYTVTFNFESDGEPLMALFDLGYGTEITTPGNLEKDSDDYFNYTFVGWELSPVDSGLFFIDGDTVTGDATYNAKFSSETILYTITFNFEINGEPATMSFDLGYGTEITTPGNLEKESDAQFDYTFVGWELSPVDSGLFFIDGDTVTGDATYNVKFSSETREYTITWIVDGIETNKTDTLAYGATPDYGVAPTKEATAQYTFGFTGWDTEVVDVIGNATYTAQFSETVNEYTITWIVDGIETNKTDTLAYGATPDYGVAPTKEATAQYTFGFTGWDTEVVDVIGNATYTAQFSETVNEYTITWIVDGIETNKTDTLAYGATPDYGVAPTKEATAQYTFGFTGWDTEVVDVIGNATYTAQFSETVNEYTITWIVDGIETNKTDTLAYGATPDYGVAPTKEATAQYTFGFTGWDTEVVDVIGNATYTAQFSETVNEYTITWIVDGIETNKTDTLAYGATPNYGTDPTKTATAQYTFGFTGWSPAVANVTGDATYTAQFSETLNEYTITWIVDGIATNKTDTLAYGATPNYGTDPTKTATAQYTFGFTGWSPAVANVTGDATYTAQFSETLNEYTITWIVDGIATNKTDTLLYGATPNYGTDPTKTATAQYTFGFTGWDTEVVDVIGNATYTAQFSETVNEYTITWIVDGIETNKTDTLAYGATPDYGVAPTKEATAQYTFGFTGWDTEVVDVIGNATYTAQFSETVNEYTITWIVDGIETNKTDTLAYGATPDYGVAPTKEATAQYTFGFTGWDTEVVDVIGNATYTAQFSETVNEYTITWIVDGIETNKTDTLAYGATPDYGVAPTKEATAQYTFGFTGWDTEVVDVIGNATYTAQFSETVNEYTITWIVDGITDTSLVAYGEMPKYASEVNTIQHTYTITGWTPEIVNVIGGVEYTATFSKALRIYETTPSTEVLNDLISQNDDPVLKLTEDALGMIDNSVFLNLGDKLFIINVMKEDGVTLAYSWTFSGDYKAEQGTIFNAGISESAPSEDLNAAIDSAKVESSLVLKFEASGELPADASVKYYVGDKYEVGTELSLFLYNEDTKKLDDQSQKVKVDAEGYVTFSLEHCSYYVLAEISPEAVNNTMLYVGIAIVVIIIVMIAIVALRSKN